MKPTIRGARREDLAAINEIYNHYVLTSTATFHEEPMSARARQAWWAEREHTHTVLVADEGQDVVGWAALSDYSGRQAYRFTVSSAI